MIVEVDERARWDAQYLSERSWPWDTGRPSSELRRVVASEQLAPCRVLELGCGTGTNAVWLAERGFQVTAVDISRVAIERARQRAIRHRVAARFVVADLATCGRLSGPYDFFFDRGCFHSVRRRSGRAYLEALGHAMREGALGLVLAGNDGETEDGIGPPVFSQQELREELGEHFDILHLREFRFDAPTRGAKRYLAWSCLLRRR
jgi:SAM-dependent methyltransferase